jgi:hypothetical protein
MVNGSTMGFCKMFFICSGMTLRTGRVQRRRKATAEDNTNQNHSTSPYAGNGHPVSSSLLSEYELCALAAALLSLSAKPATLSNPAQTFFNHTPKPCWKVGVSQVPPDFSNSLAYTIVMQKHN